MAWLGLGPRWLAVGWLGLGLAWLAYDLTFYGISEWCTIVYNMFAIFYNVLGAEFDRNN